MLILPNFLSLLKDRWFIMTHSDQQERQGDIHPIHSYASSRPVDYIWTRNLAKSGWRTRGGDCPDLQRWKPSSGNAYRTNKVKTVIDEIWVNFYCHLYTYIRLFFIKVVTVRLAQIPAPDSSVVSLMSTWPKIQGAQVYILVWSVVISLILLQRQNPVTENQWLGTAWPPPSPTHPMVKLPVWYTYSIYQTEVICIQISKCFSAYWNRLCT